MSDRTVLVTGAFGFIGSHLVRSLRKAGVRIRAVSIFEVEPGDEDLVVGDLTNPETCARAVQGVQDVYHLAAFGWGLGENQKFPAQLLTQNVLMSTNLLEAARKAGVERYLYTSSSSVYSGHLEVLEEDSPWDTPPHGSEAYFGWAKRLGELQARAYVENYGMKIAIVRPSNPYGPGDDFEPTRCHVIPALISRIASRQSPLVVWGTGRVVRSFVYVEDVVRGMLLAMEKAGDADPVNLASRETTSIGELVRLIVELGGEDLRIEFDPSKPEGHPRKVPSTSKAESKLGFRASTSLRQGLKKTIDWYHEHIHR